MTIRLFRDAQGEPRLWSHTGHKSSLRNFRWWLHGPGGWCFNVEWVINLKQTFALSFSIGENDLPAISLYFGLPFLFTLYLTLESKRFRPLVPTVRTKSYVRPGEYWDMPITRRVGVKVFGGKIWFDLWSAENDSSHNKKWQEFNFAPLDFIFGHSRYSRLNELSEETKIIMPEGRYPATITIYTAVWSRPRWPFARRVERVEVEIPGGIPIPGKGESSWDVGDDAIVSVTVAAETREEAKRKVFGLVMDRRIRCAAADWQPAAGWPDTRANDE